MWLEAQHSVIQKDKNQMLDSTDSVPRSKNTVIEIGEITQKMLETPLVHLH